MRHHPRHHPRHHQRRRQPTCTATSCRSAASSAFSTGSGAGGDSGARFPRRTEKDMSRSCMVRGGTRARTGARSARPMPAAAPAAEAGMRAGETPAAAARAVASAGDTSCTRREPAAEDAVRSWPGGGPAGEGWVGAKRAGLARTGRMPGAGVRCGVVVSGDIAGDTSELASAKVLRRGGWIPPPAPLAVVATALVAAGAEGEGARGLQPPAAISFSARICTQGMRVNMEPAAPQAMRGTWSAQCTVPVTSCCAPLPPPAAYRAGGGGT